MKTAPRWNNVLIYYIKDCPFAAGVASCAQVGPIRSLLIRHVAAARFIVLALRPLVGVLVVRDRHGRQLPRRHHEQQFVARAARQGLARATCV